MGEAADDEVYHGKVSPVLEYTLNSVLMSIQIHLPRIFSNPFITKLPAPTQIHGTASQTMAIR
jgi:hypothetical protein